MQFSPGAQERNLRFRFQDSCKTTNDLKRVRTNQNEPVWSKTNQQMNQFGVLFGSFWLVLVRSGVFWHYKLIKNDYKMETYLFYISDREVRRDLT